MDGNDEEDVSCNEDRDVDDNGENKVDGNDEDDVDGNEDRDVDDNDENNVENNIDMCVERLKISLDATLEDIKKLNTEVFPPPEEDKKKKK